MPKPTQKTSGKMPEKAPGASTDVPRLAIACQGGGAHTAFTAGVLAYLFLSFEHFRTIGEEGRWFRLLGLSGTSGGAITAAMAWSEAPDDSWAEGARRVLRYWNRNKASFDTRDKLPIWWGEYFTNATIQWGMSLQRWLPEVNFPPSGLASALIQGRMKDDMRAVVGLPDQADRFFGRKGVDLFVGAVDVVNPGDEPQTAFRTFPDQPAFGLRLDELLASACIPELFVATPLSVKEDAGTERGTRVFWDGLYSQNPPINDFFDGRSSDCKPDLLWVVQINPNRYEGADAGPQNPEEQADRRNELAGKLSLASVNSAMRHGVGQLAQYIEEERQQRAAAGQHAQRRTQEGTTQGRRNGATDFLRRRPQRVHLDGAARPREMPFEVDDDLGDAEQAHGAHVVHDVFRNCVRARDFIFRRHQPVTHEPAHGVQQPVQKVWIADHREPPCARNDGLRFPRKASPPSRDSAVV